MAHPGSVVALLQDRRRREATNVRRHGHQPERPTLDEAPEACRRLHEGAIRGHAVVVP